jgi:hypothetical protein
MENKLNPGHYMKCEPVMTYFYHINVKTTLASIILKACPIYSSEGHIFFNTIDLKSVISEELYRELSSQVTTHWVTE